MTESRQKEHGGNDGRMEMMRSSKMMRSFREQEAVYKTVYANGRTKYILQEKKYEAVY